MRSRSKPPGSTSKSIAFAHPAVGWQGRIHFPVWHMQTLSTASNWHNYGAVPRHALGIHTHTQTHARCSGPLSLPSFLEHNLWCTN